MRQRCGMPSAGRVAANWVAAICVLCFWLGSSEVRSENASQSGVGNVIDKIREINREASAVGDEGRFESLQRLHRERLKCMAYAWAADPDNESVWVRAFDVFIRVNGYQNNFPGKVLQGRKELSVPGWSLPAVDAKPVRTHLGLQEESYLDDYLGLVDRCCYDEAFEAIAKEWSESKDDAGSGFCGDLAVLAAEVFAQQRGVLRSELIDQEKEIAVRQMLREAGELDPCCFMAKVVLDCLEGPSESEAFQRAEVRRDFGVRQQRLAGLAHAGRPDEEIQSWHAPVESAKAITLSSIIKDLSYAAPLRTDTPVYKDGVLAYVAPSEVLTGRDGQGLPFALVYGRALLCNVVDESGRARSAFLFVDNDGVWQRYYVDLLHQEKSRAAETEASKLCDRLPVTAEFNYSPVATYKLYALPCDQINDVLRLKPQLWFLTDAFKLLKGRGASDFFVRLQPSERVLRESPVGTSGLVAQAMNFIRQNKDATVHQLDQLMSQEAFNPLIAVSEGDRVKSEPNWIVREGRKFLRTDAGEELTFVQDPDAPEKAAFEITRDAVKVVYPLTFSAIPAEVLEETAFGQACVHMCLKAGYTLEEANQEVAKYMRAVGDGKQYVPRKFRSLISKKARSSGVTDWTAAWELLAESVLETLPDQFRAAGKEAAKVVWETRVERLREVGRRRGPVDLAYIPQGFVNRFLVDPKTLFFETGFRHVVGPNGNYIVNKSVTQAKVPVSADQGANQTAGADRTEASYLDYPFDIRAPEGVGRIASTQIYTMRDYQDIWENVLVEHLGPLLMLQPCFPAIEQYVNFVGSPPQNPSENIQTEANRYLDGNSLDAAAEGGLAAGGSQAPSFVKVVQAFSPEYVKETLYAGDKEDPEAEVVSSLNALFAAYSEMFRTECVFRAKMRRYAGLIVLLDYLRAYGLLDEGNSSRAAELIGQWGGDSGPDRGEGEASVIEKIQLDAARQQAVNGKFHKAIVYYNDLLHYEVSRGAADLNFSLFENVATADAVESFSEKLLRVVEDEVDEIIMEVELAGVLRRTDSLRASGKYLAASISEEFRQILKPTIELAMEYIIAYGLRVRPALKEELAKIEAAVRDAEAIHAEFGEDLAWRTGCLVEQADDPELEQLAGQIADLLGEGLSAEDSQRRLKILEKKAAAVISLPVWLKWQRAVEANPSFAFGGGCLVSPDLFVPNDYDAERGFVGDAYEVLQETTDERVVEFCTCDNPVEKFGERDAAVLAAIVGWYWAEQGDALKASQACLGGYSFLEQFFSDEQRPASERLVCERNFFGLFIASQSFRRPLPGIMYQRVGLGRGLTPRMLDWERRWFAAGQNGLHSTRQVDLLQNAQKVVGVSAMVESRANRESRYYFPDYRFRCKGLPDNVLLKFLIERRNFEERIEAVEVAEDGQEAVQQEAWGLQTEEEAKAFLVENFSFEAEVDKEVVFGDL